MVKIIKKAPHKDVKKQVVCGECGATLEYVPNEVKSYSGTDKSGGPDGCEWVNCPNCSKRAIIRSW
jgi:ribosomal protein S27AE